MVVFTSGILALSGKWSAIWPMFGATNQLVAAFTFLVVSSWFLCRGKSLKYTFFPAVFMILTAIGALLYQLVKFVREGNIILAAISIILVILAVLMVGDAAAVVKKKKLRSQL
ncbi:MAG: hypothetical protein KJ902_05895 [Candidatus Omnitrophica bacterium]|nr:hypothetical protein [Candidatus Omnitrophota bacterium]